MPSFETLLLEFDTPLPNTATLTINRPKALNALNSLVSEELSQAIDEIVGKADLRALIITGAGKSFVAGADISEMVKLSSAEARHFLHTLQQTLNRLEQLSIPVIAKINGYALGGGLELALACDIRIASDNALLGLPEVTLGLIPAGGGTQRLSRIVGEGIAKYLIMTAKRMKAEEALSYGIISEMVKSEDLDESVEKLVSNLLRFAPVAIGAAKHSIQASLNENIRSGLEIELDNAVRCFQTKDLREGMNAFIEKRKADFVGK